MEPDDGGAMVASERRVMGSKRTPVRACFTTGGGGEVERRLVVLCRERGAVIPFEECAECPRCDGWVLDPDRAQSFVVCQPEWDVKTEPDGGPYDPLAALLATPVREVMTLGAHCVTADVSLETVMALFVDEGISGAPVIDDHGRPIGVVSKTDLVRSSYQEESRFVSVDAAELERYGSGRGGAGLHELGDALEAREPPRLSVGDIMTPLCFSLAEQTPLGHAAALMAYEGIHRAPVLDAAGRVAGMLSSFDVMRFLAEVSEPVRSPT